MDLRKHQIKSMRAHLPRALEYHFSNFKVQESVAAPSAMQDGEGMSSAAKKFEAREAIKFEVQAYLCQLRRFKFFIESLKKERGLEEPKEPAPQYMWHSIMDKEGLINILSNKWAAHRSFDDPRGEDDLLHAQILINLDGTTTMWGGDHLILGIDKREFDLCEDHPKVIEFISWVFKEIGEV